MEALSYFRTPGCTGVIKAPDEEVPGTGATMERLADEGRNVDVVTMFKHTVTGGPLACGNQSTYNRVANAEDL